MKITRFEDLNCWKTSRSVVKQVYQISNIGAFKQDFGFKGSNPKSFCLNDDQHIGGLCEVSH